MAKNKITDLVLGLLEEYFQGNPDKGLSLYHLEFVKEGPDKVLRVFIDKDKEYVSTEDCEEVSRYLSDKLDDLDPIEQNYVLEVSSPGMDRVLVTPEHFERYKGEEVEVSLYREIEGTKKLEGTLLDYSQGNIKLKVENDKGEAKEVELESKDFAKVNLAVVI